MLEGKTNLDIAGLGLGTDLVGWLVGLMALGDRAGGGVRMGIVFRARGHAGAPYFARRTHTRTNPRTYLSHLEKYLAPSYRANQPWPGSPRSLLELASAGKTSG